METTYPNPTRPPRIQNMPDVLFWAALFALTYLAFALLAISQKRHWQRLTDFAPCSANRALTIRIAGYVLLAVGLTLALVREGPSFGAVLWGTTISIGAAAVATTLTWRPLWLRPIVIHLVTRA